VSVYRAADAKHRACSQTQAQGRVAASVDIRASARHLVIIVGTAEPNNAPRMPTSMTVYITSSKSGSASSSGRVLFARPMLSIIPIVVDRQMHRSAVPGV
jgi:hypothetical protein